MYTVRHLEKPLLCLKMLLNNHASLAFQAGLICRAKKQMHTRIHLSGNGSYPSW